MGMIKIEIAGSFLKIYSRNEKSSAQFSALTHGHADAVAEAIEWLVVKVLPQAIALDHRLHEQGEKPSHGFGVGTR